MIKIIDDLLPHQQWQELHDYFLIHDCPYKYLDHMVSGGDSHFQFVHGIVLGGIGGAPIFDETRIKRIEPILTRLNIDFLLRAKVNLTTRTSEPLQSNFHCDTNQNNLTAIYYVNTCNGKTRFENPDIEDVDSIANRVIIFNAQQKHCTVTATDVKARVVANINYLPIRKRSNGL